MLMHARIERTKSRMIISWYTSKNLVPKDTITSKESTRGSQWFPSLYTDFPLFNKHGNFSR